MNYITFTIKGCLRMINLRNKYNINIIKLLSYNTTHKIITNNFSIILFKSE